MVSFSMECRLCVHYTTVLSDIELPPVYGTDWECEFRAQSEDKF